MASLNRVVLIGNLTKDPELRSTPSGQSVTTLRLAVNERRKIGEEWQEVAHFFDVTVWGKQAENCNLYLKKGRPVAVDGRLSSRQWETPEGQKRTAVEVVAEHVVFLGGGDGSRGAGSAGPAADENVDAPAADDDIPF
jgi:single-strand DNA-binding protein